MARDRNWRNAGRKPFLHEHEHKELLYKKARLYQIPFDRIKALFNTEDVNTNFVLKKEPLVDLSYGYYTVLELLYRGHTFSNVKRLTNLSHRAALDVKLRIIQAIDYKKTIMPLDKREQQLERRLKSSKRVTDED